MSLNLSDSLFASVARYEYVATTGSAAFSGKDPLVTISHNLGYTPYFKCYVLFSGDTYYYYVNTSSDLVYYGESNQLQVSSLYANSTDLYCQFNNGTASGTFYYRIYAEPQS